METKSKWSEGAVKTPEFPNHNYTYEDYLKWDGQWELIDGVPYSMAPSPSFTHQYIIFYLKIPVEKDGADIPLNFPYSFLLKGQP